MSNYVELYMDQGTNFSTSIQINNELNNTPQDVSSYHVTSQMRKSYLSQNVSATLVCTPQGNTGVILISLDSANTANIPAGSYFFDVKVHDNLLSTTTRLIEGIIFVTPEITQ